MNLIGVHVRDSFRWPLKLPSKSHPQDAILFNTCNRMQYLCEPKDRDAIFECFDGYDVKPIEYKNIDCVRKLTEMSFGLDSVNKGSMIIRKQMLYAKNESGTKFLKNVVSTVIDVSEKLIPFSGYRKFSSAIQFFKFMGLDKIHIVTSGELVNGGKDCYPYWHTEAFDCDCVIFAGSIKSLPVSTENCTYCINFSFDLQTPRHLIDLTELFDTYVSKGGPQIVDVAPIADLVWYKFENEINKKRMVKDLKDMGFSTTQLSYLLRHNKL
jgi:hypothetical protein